MKKYIGAILLSTCAFLSGCSTFFSSGSSDQSIQQAEAIKEECRTKWQNPKFDPIRNKIEFYPTTEGGKFAFNDKYPTKTERPLIREMAELHDYCEGKVGRLIYVTHPSIGIRSINQANAVNKELLNLYNRKITWGEFTQRRYDIINARATVETQEAQRRHKAEMEKAERYRQRMIENEMRRSEEAARQAERNQSKHTTTYCTTTPFGEVQCNSTQW